MRIIALTLMLYLTGCCSYNYKRKAFNVKNNNCKNLQYEGKSTVKEVNGVPLLTVEAFKK